MKYKLILLIALSVYQLGDSQITYAKKLTPDSNTIQFKDTLFNLVFDSISNNLGMISPTNKNNRLVKHFKYIGKTPLYIKGNWTTDPHFICEFPKDILIPNKIYSFTVCFWHQDRQGTMYKTMGFYLSDGNTITLKFKGVYLPIENEEH